MEGNIKGIIIMLLLFGSCASSFSQEIIKTQDIGVWIGANLEYKIDKDYKIRLSQDLRLYENSKKVEKYITDLGLNYRINKKFSLGTNIRYFLNRKKDKTLSQDWRYNIDFKYKKKYFKKIGFKYRLRFQSIYENLFGVVKGGINSNLRNYVELKYKVNKSNSVYSSFELFREITVYRKPYFNKFRVSIGNQIESNIGNFNLSINYERALNSNYPFKFLFFRINHVFKYKK